MLKDGKWKAEGGFRSGYLAHLEKLFKESMPECGLKFSNIDSRSGYLKRRYYALHEIKHKGSGFGWDDTSKMVKCDRKLFEEWAKSHKDAKGMYKKPFLLFDRLDEIFSKDRATGSKSAMPIDRDDEESIREKVQENILDNVEEEISKENEIVPSELSGTKKRSGDCGSSKKAMNKKKKNREIESVQKSFGTMMENMMRDSNEHIAKLISMFEAPKNFKAGLREELGKVPGISRSQVLSLCLKMTEDEVVIFRDLSDDDEKYDLLTMILEKP